MTTDDISTAVLCPSDQVTKFGNYALDAGFDTITESSYTDLSTERKTEILDEAVESDTVVIIGYEDPAVAKTAHITHIKSFDKFAAMLTILKNEQENGEAEGV